MANAVFTAKLHSNYDDIVEERYHFPKRYLKRVEQSVGDWIIYYESRRDGGSQTYFAMARVLGVDRDVARADHYYAQIGDYVEFAEPVPFRQGGELLEMGVRNIDGTVNPGSFVNSVRRLSREDFKTICQLGFAPALEEAGLNPTLVESELSVAETQAEYGGPRRVATVSRPMRDAAFSKIVKRAYDRTCAMTGLKLVNGGGRSEIEAAHIKPVENDGPDSPRNGIALSRTVHWLFDRGFLSMSDDGSILEATGLVPEPVRRLLNPDRRVLRPADSVLAPHAAFLRFHRETKFKG